MKPARLFTRRAGFCPFSVVLSVPFREAEKYPHHGFQCVRGDKFEDGMGVEAAVERLGQGSPIKESVHPSVPPRTGASIGVTPSFANALRAFSMR